MKRVETIAIGCCAGLLTIAAVGCGTSGGDPGGGEPTATMTVDLTLAPPDARCAVITVTPQMGAAVQRQFALTPETAATFTMTGLPTGNVTVAEQVFTAACPITTQTPTWTAAPVMVNLDPSVPVTVTFNLQRTDAGGQLAVITNFPTGGMPTFREFPTPTQVDFMAAGPDDNIWFTNSVGPGAIGRLTLGGALTSFPLLNPTNEVATAITGGPDGNVWFGILDATSSGFNKVGRSSTSGSIFEFSLPLGTDFPTAIRTGADGNLWFTEATTNKIARFSTAGTLTEFNVPTANSQPIRLAAGPDGNIWFTEETGNRIGRISPTGSIVEFNIPSTDAFPLGVTAGSDGNVWITERFANKLARVIPSTGAISEIVIPTFNSNPGEIVNGADANLWFAEAAGKIGQLQLHN